MPIPDYDQLCVGFEVSEGEKCIFYPGGGSVCVSIPTYSPPSPSQLAQDLLAKINTALAPAQPIFNIIDAVLAVFQCVKAIATLNPVKIIECIPNLAQKVAALVKLIPPLSMPALIGGVIECLVLYLEGMIADIEAQQEYLARIQAAELAVANTDIEIGPIIECATADLDQIIVFKGQQAAPVNRLIGIINGFLQVLGLPCIPSIGTPSLDPGFIELLRQMIEFLSFLASLLQFEIPLPDASVSADDC